MDTTSLLLIYDIVSWAVRLIMIPVVVSSRRPNASALAWIAVIFLSPIVGVFFYFMFGTRRISKQHTLRRAEMTSRVQAGQQKLAHRRLALEPLLDQSQRAVSLEAQRLSGFPVLGGNTVQMIGSTSDFVKTLIAEIDAADHLVHLDYYIFAPDEVGQTVVEALIRARRRNVACRVLVDYHGSHRLLGDRAIMSAWHAVGVEVVGALPVTWRRWRASRIDLRNHRKLAVIDNRVALIGSHNIIHEAYGGKRGGPWHDLTARIEGPLVADLHSVFLEDWASETSQELRGEDVQRGLPPVGHIAGQVIATGPVRTGDSFRRALIAALNAAHERVIMTTPYFVPDEATLLAMCMAVDRGVEVHVIVPRGGDNFLATMASRAFFLPLLEEGVKIHRFRPGLIHAKTTSVDDQFAIIGSANFDMRSFNLNFELNVVLYGAQPASQLRAVQQHYMADCEEIRLSQWRQRSKVVEFGERIVALMAPLL